MGFFQRFRGAKSSAEHAEAVEVAKAVLAEQEGVLTTLEAQREQLILAGDEAGMKRNLVDMESTRQKLSDLRVAIGGHLRRREEASRKEVMESSRQKPPRCRRTANWRVRRLKDWTWPPRPGGGSGRADAVDTELKKFNERAARQAAPISSAQHLRRDLLIGGLRRLWPLPKQEGLPRRRPARSGCWASAGEPGRAWLLASSGVGRQAWLTTPLRRPSGLAIAQAGS